MRKHQIQPMMMVTLASIAITLARPVASPDGQQYGENRYWRD